MIDTNHASPPKRAITAADIMPMEQYASERKTTRRNMIAYKKCRRMQLGPHCTLLFENFVTMLYQVHEMLYTEGNTEGQLDDELAAYNPLIPRGNVFSVTMLLDIEDEALRHRVLLGLTNIEEHLFIECGHWRVQASYEQDVDRTADDGKTSSVHFLHFAFTQEQSSDLARGTDKAIFVCDHANYQHMAVIPPAVLQSICLDL